MIYHDMKQIEFLSCFINIESANERSSLISVVNGAHTAIYNFITDVHPLFKNFNAEKNNELVIN